MRFIRISKRESPLLVAREVLWRARRAWKKSRILGRLEHPGHVEFRNVPYYNPDPLALSEHSRALIVAFADEIRAGRYPFLGDGTAELGTRPMWNFDFLSRAQRPYMRSERRAGIRYDGPATQARSQLSRLQFLPVLRTA